MTTNPESEADGRTLIVGVDVGGTKIRTALADAQGRIIAESVCQTPTGGLAVLEGIVQEIWSLQINSGKAQVPLLSAGVGLPGVVDPSSGGLGMAPNLPGLEALNVREWLESRLSCGVETANDVNLAGLAERTHAHRDHDEDFLFLSLGTGVGAAVFTDGGLVNGSRGAAGELGTAPIVIDTLSGTVGTAEDVLAGDSISHNYNSAHGTDLSTREVMDLADDGDIGALSVVTDYATTVAQLIALASSVVDTRVVALGGGVGSRPTLRPLVCQALRRFEHWRHVEIITAELGHRAGVIGAVQLAAAVAHDPDSFPQPAIKGT